MKQWTQPEQEKKKEFQSFKLTSSETGEIIRGVDDLLSLVTFNIITEAIILLYVGARLLVKLMEVQIPSRQPNNQEQSPKQPP